MFRRMLAAATLTIITLSPVAASSRADTGVYKQTLPAVAWVVTEKPDAKKPGMYEGTAWVIDKENRLLMTNNHVIEDAKTIRVYFPQSKNGTLMTDRDWYMEKGRSVRAKVIVADPRRDLAVIQVETLPAGVKELKLADGSPEVGEEVFTVGNPGHEDNLWIGNVSTVKSVKRETIVTREGSRFEGTRQETRLAISPGASGSPVVNAAGEVIGVVFCGDFVKAGEPATRAYSVDVVEIRTVLAKARKAGSDEKADEGTSPKGRNDGQPESRGKKMQLLPIGN